MMIYPPIAELVEKTGSRYALVIEAAKRTRQLVDGAPRLSDVDTSKDVTVAVNEIHEGKIEAIKHVDIEEPEKTEEEVESTEAATEVEAQEELV